MGRTVFSEGSGGIAARNFEQDAKFGARPGQGCALARGRLIHPLARIGDGAVGLEAFLFDGARSWCAHFW